ncbi:MAG: glycosyltransferase family 39 protein [Bacteroidetes bacterium]|nr:glycosyltransferase family 39 protein [Bacteroidota bacterium]
MFTLLNPMLLACSILIHGIACFFFFRRRMMMSILALLMANLLLRVWSAGLDPFLNNWDEKFHALVALNLSHHWLKPTLVDRPYLPTDPHFWFYTHVWLHKQPLFLWQMALSIKLFGANLWAVRLPSIVIGVLLVAVVYDLGRLCFNRDVGYIAAFLLSFYEPILDMNSGLGYLEHNSLCFVFYVTLSIWAWVKFEKNPKFRWAVFFAVAAGCAVLTKWLTGTLVFVGYLVYHGGMVRDLLQKRTITIFLSTAAICFLVFLPWQLYTLHTFPSEAAYELSYNSRHFTEVIEGHQGGPFYYVDLLKEHYMLLQVLIFIGFAFCLADIVRYRFAIVLMMMSTVVYLFFSIAATKMDEYVLMVSPMLILFMAFALYRMMDWFRAWLGTDVFRFTQIIIICIVSWQLFHYAHFLDFHAPRPEQWYFGYRKDRITQTQWIAQNKSQWNDNNVIINCQDYSYIDVMFYSGHTAYGFVGPSDEQKLRDQGKHLIYFGSAAR